MKWFRMISFLLLIGVLATAFGCNKTPTDQPEDNRNIFLGLEFPYYIGEDLEVTDAFLYSGAFPEDGSFDQKENVFALKVKNLTDKDIQLVRIYVTTNLNKYQFEITTLPVGKSVTVMEKNAATVAAQGEGVTRIHRENQVFFKDLLSLRADLFEVNPSQKVINIKNKSTTDIETDVYVYYKKVDANGDFFGGVTFRSKAGPMPAGQFRQIPASVYNPADSKVLCVDYAK